MNGGIQPTVELATNNGGVYPYPVYAMNNGGGFGGFGSDSAIWLIVLLALIWGGNNGNNGFFGGNNFDDGYAWLSNGQKEIMSNTNQGFDTLHLSNQLEGTRDGIYSLSNQLCNVGNDITSAINTTAYNSEIAAANRQMASMQQNFDLSRQFADCCCENRLGIQDLKATVISENCQDREVLREIGQSILVNQSENTNRIISELFKDRLDEKDDKIAELNRQLQTAELRASQIAQTSNIVDMTYNRLATCPVDTVPVYGNTRIFSCNNGCGCNNGFYGNGTSF